MIILIWIILGIIATSVLVYSEAKESDKFKGLSILEIFLIIITGIFFGWTMVVIAYFLLANDPLIPIGKIESYVDKIAKENDLVKFLNEPSFFKGK